MNYKDTWPDNLYVYHENIESNGVKIYTGQTTYAGEDVKYIRTNIANKREDRLINATKLLCDTTLNLWVPRFPTTEEIYEKAGLGELK